jgi:hypothetical protein
MRLTAALRSSTATLSASVTNTFACDQLVPKTLEARRSGEPVSGPLQQVGPCQFQGVIQLPERGRWFFYAELTYHDQKVETWLPVITGGTGTYFEKLASLYELEAVSSSTIEVVSGILLYILILALFSAILLVVRHQHLYREHQARGATSA